MREDDRNLIDLVRKRNVDTAEFAAQTVRGRCTSVSVGYDIDYIYGLHVTVGIHNWQAFRLFTVRRTSKNKFSFETSSEYSRCSDVLDKAISCADYDSWFRKKYVIAMKAKTFALEEIVKVTMEMIRILNREHRFCMFSFDKQRVEDTGELMNKYNIQSFEDLENRIDDGLLDESETSETSETEEPVQSESQNVRTQNAEDDAYTGDVAKCIDNVAQFMTNLIHRCNELNVGGMTDCVYGLCKYAGCWCMFRLFSVKRVSNNIFMFESGFDMQRVFMDTISQTEFESSSRKKVASKDLKFSLAEVVDIAGHFLWKLHTSQNFYMFSFDMQMISEMREKLNNRKDMLPESLDGLVPDADNESKDVNSKTINRWLRMKKNFNKQKQELL